MLKIDFYLGSPVVLDFPIHLDAIIDNVWAYENGLADEPLADPKEYKRSGVFKETNGVPHTSVGLLIGVTGLEYWHKRFDMDGIEALDFGGRKEQIRIGAGAFKSYQMPLRTITAERITFFCEGHEEQIVKLAYKVTAIGKKRSYGYGCVRDVKIVELPSSHFVFIRNLPTTLFAKPFVRSFKMRAGWRSPYWYRADYQECWVPAKFIFASQSEFDTFVKGGE